MTQAEVTQKHNEAIRLIRSKFSQLGEEKFSRMWDAIWNRTDRLRGRLDG